MDEMRRFDIILERHIGFGIRWEVGGVFPFHLSVGVPFVSFTVGFGRRRG